MDDEAVEKAFQEWLESEGDDIAESVYKELKMRAGRFEVEDGSHASWVEDDLGILIVLPFEHAMAFGHESEHGDFDNSPVHSFVFATITELILRACALMDD
jgi:hypothetical protein|tara:strand:+ start:7229 stop:7531 length:303 start_codon:yes stop_codon:yes gene_type:complete